MTSALPPYLALTQPSSTQLPKVSPQSETILPGQGEPLPLYLALHHNLPDSNQSFDCLVDCPTLLPDLSFSC